MPFGVGSGLGRLWRISMRSRRGRVARLVEVDGGIRASRLYAGDGVIGGGRTHVGAGAPGTDGLGGSFVGVDGLCRDAADVFFGFESPPAGVGSVMPANCGRSRRRTAAVPVRAYWARPFLVRRRAADAES